MDFKCASRVSVFECSIVFLIRKVAMELAFPSAIKTFLFIYSVYKYIEYFVSVLAHVALKSCFKCHRLFLHVSNMSSTLSSLWWSEKALN